MSNHAEGDANGPTMSSPTALSHLGLNPLISPSDYLHSHCPLCFGGVDKVGECNIVYYIIEFGLKSHVYMADSMESNN